MSKCDPNQSTRDVFSSFEQLEPRVLLTVISSMPLAEYLGTDVPAGIVLEVEGASDTGNYLWSPDVNHEGDPDRVEWMRLADGSVRTPADVLGAEADIYSIADNGLALWWNEQTDELWMTDLGTGIGAPLFAEPPELIGRDVDYLLRPDHAEAIENGEVYLQIGDGVSLIGVWQFDPDAGELSHVWDGFFNDVGGDGTVIGSRLELNDQGALFTTPVARVGTSNQTVPTSFVMRAVNDTGTAVRATGASLWDLNTDREIGGWRPPSGSTAAYSLGVDISNGDWGLAIKVVRGSVIGGGSATTSIHFIRADIGDLDHHFTDTPLPRNQDGFLESIIDDNGRAYIGDMVFIAESLRSELVFSSSDVSIVALANGVFLAAAVDQNGGNRTFVIRSDSVTANIITQVATSSDADIKLILDPAHNGAVLAVGAAFGIGGDGLSYDDYGQDGFYIVRPTFFWHTTPDEFEGARITGFAAADERLVIAGVSDLGELHLSYEIEPGTWMTRSGEELPEKRRLDNFSNLTTEHLDARGLDTPEFVGDIVGYSTPWGGQNIAGLNAEGEVEIVWWAPGLGDLWTTNNISKEIGAPKLVGNISAVATPWETINIVGTDADGTAWMLHWAPSYGAGNWRVTNLTESAAGAALQAGSLTAHVTGWNGLVFTGIEQDTGCVASYWWEATIDRWVYEVLAPDEAAPVGALSSAASATEQSIVGVAEDGSLLRYWSTFDSGWQVDNLSELAVI